MTLGRESGKAQGKVAALSPSSPSRRLERKAQRPWWWGIAVYLRLTGLVVLLVFGPQMLLSLPVLVEPRQGWPGTTAPLDCPEVSEAWQHLIWCQAQEVFCAAQVQGRFPHLLVARPPTETLLANIVISFSHPGSIRGYAGDSGVTWPFLPCSSSFMLAQEP